VIALTPARLVLAWRERRNLPPPRPDKRQRHGKDRRELLYEERVATRPLIEPIEDACTFFAANRHLLPDVPEC
jgi:hypothetical protein